MEGGERERRGAGGEGDRGKIYVFMSVKPTYFMISPTVGKECWMLA